MGVNWNEAEGEDLAVPKATYHNTFHCIGKHFGHSIKGHDYLLLGSVHNPLLVMIIGMT